MTFVDPATSRLMLFFFLGALSFRLAMLAVSIKRERALKQGGAVEIGAGNSKLLALVHMWFYFSALIEGLFRNSPFDQLSTLGLVLYAFGIVSLLVVVRLLGRFWTVKLLIAPDHKLVTHPLFRLFRHPNYFLNLLPELTGYALVFHAYATLTVVLGFYLIPLSKRITQEELAMAERFEDYKSELREF